MNNNELKAKRHRHEDRVTLEAESLQRVDGWIEQVTSTTKGVTVTRKDVVNWMVSQRGPLLSSNEVNGLRTQFFSDVRFLQQAIKELKSAKRRGDQVDLSEILSSANHAQVPAPKRRLVRRKSQAKDTDCAAPETLVDSPTLNPLG